MSVRLAIPYHALQIEENDFNVPLPSLESGPNSARAAQPVLYHIFMARTSTVYYQFRAALRQGIVSVTTVVRRADEALAEIIGTLPDHLQPDDGNLDGTADLKADHPWITWQRFDLSVVLLHHRMRINRALQDEWLKNPGSCSWARTVCVHSAMNIIWITHNWHQPAGVRRQWFVLNLMLYHWRLI